MAKLEECRLAERVLVDGFSTAFQSLQLYMLPDILSIKADGFTILEILDMEILANKKQLATASS